MTCTRNLECENWQFRCFNGKECIHIARRCDGVHDCSDRSDEQPDVCPLQTTSLDLYRPSLLKDSSPMWNCDGGKTTAIGLHQLCNGMAECVDDSDEKHCRCSSPADDFDCTAWQKWAIRSFEERPNERDCIPRSLICDGIPHCRNGADELSMLCSIMRPEIQETNGFSIAGLLDFSKRQPAYIIIIIALLSAFLLILIIGCCIYFCYRKKQIPAKLFAPNDTATLMGTQRTMMTDAASPASHHFATTRLTLPSNQHHQVEVALRTYPCSNGGGSDYGYIPSQFHPPSSAATLNFRHHQHPPPPPSSYGYHTLPWNPQSNQNIQIVNADILPAPHGADFNMAFYAPPPSAASLSTYGVVKPAGMKINITPRKGNNTYNRNTARRSDRQSTLGRRNREEEKFKEELKKLSGPPSYSEV